MDASQNLKVESDAEQEWTKVEFLERRRSPYSHATPATDTAAAPKASFEGTMPSGPGAFPTGDSSSSGYSSGNAHSSPPPRPRNTASEEASPDANAGGGVPRPGPSRTRVPRPRQCRICLDVVHPVLQESTLPSIPGMAPQPPRYVYEDEDGGRLINPCKCKGSARYVHEACLQQWRMTSYASRNYWHCPTCGYNYRLERLTYAKYIQSVPSQLVLTGLFFIVAMFVMGFIADPIINLYLDPWTLVGWGYSDASILEPIFNDEDKVTWYEHFLKGMAGLGVMGFLKFMVASPLQIFRTRIGGGGGQGGRATGRDRLESLSWVVILVGIFTTLYAIYKAVRAISRRALMRTAERVLDIGGGSNDDDDEDES